MDHLFLALIGLTAGVFSGLLGIGGGLVMIPALVFFMGYSQHMAQGTSLAVMVFPIGVFAALEYYRNGQVNPAAVAVIAVAFIVGGYFGAKFALKIDAGILKKVFAIFLIAVGIKTLLGK
jgi:uncharacterized membrane protein YfcA